jgi:hypothetical protein
MPSAITFPEADNIGGTIALRLARTHDIIAMPMPVQGVYIAAPTFVATSGWYRVRIVEDTGEFSEEEERATGGPVWRHRFVGNVAGDDIGLRNSLDAFVRWPLVVECTDGNGNVRRMGSLDNPAWMQIAPYTTGTGAAARNGYRIEIQANGDAPCPMVDGSFEPELPDPPVEESSSGGISPEEPEASTG